MIKKDGKFLSSVVKYEYEIFIMLLAWDKEQIRVPDGDRADIAHARCLGDYGFDSRWELRFFLCPTLATCWIFHLSTK